MIKISLWCGLVSSKRLESININSFTKGVIRKFSENNFLAKIFLKRLYALSLSYELPTFSSYLDAGEDMGKNTKNQSLLSIVLSYFNLSFIARLYISYFKKYREQKGSFLRFCYFIRNYMQIVIKSIKEEIQILFGTFVNRITFTSFNSGIGVIQHNMKN